MQQGTVKWFDNKKGYGFITPTNGGSDLFVHLSGFRWKGLKLLLKNNQLHIKLEQVTEVQLQLM